LIPENQLTAAPTTTDIPMINDTQTPLSDQTPGMETTTIARDSESTVSVSTESSSDKSKVTDDQVLVATSSTVGYTDTPKDDTKIKPPGIESNGSVLPGVVIDEITTVISTTTTNLPVSTLLEDSNLQTSIGVEDTTMLEVTPSPTEESIIVVGQKSTVSSVDQHKHDTESSTISGATTVYVDTQSSTDPFISQTTPSPSEKTVIDDEIVSTDPTGIFPIEESQTTATTSDKVFITSPHEANVSDHLMTTPGVVDTSTTVTQRVLTTQADEIVTTTKAYQETENTKASPFTITETPPTIASQTEGTISSLDGTQVGTVMTCEDKNCLNEGICIKISGISTVSSHVLEIKTHVNHELYLPDDEGSR